MRPLFLLQNHEALKLNDTDIDEILLNYEHYLRVARAAWLKEKFGDLRIPRDLFMAVVDADITPDVLDRLYRRGGMNFVYYSCKVVFNGGDDVDIGGIRIVQEEIRRCKKRTRNSGSAAYTISRTFAINIRSDAG